MSVCIKLGPAQQQQQQQQQQQLGLVVSSTKASKKVVLFRHWSLVATESQGTDNVLANVLSAMTQMSSTMLSMEKAMKRFPEEPEDHATPPKRRRKPPTSTMSDSGDSDPEKSDSEALTCPPKGDPPKLQTLSRTSKLTQKSLRNWRISSISDGVLILRKPN